MKRWANRPEAMAGEGEQPITADGATPYEVWQQGRRNGKVSGVTSHRVNSIPNRGSILWVSVPVDARKRVIILSQQSERLRRIQATPENSMWG